MTYKRVQIRRIAVYTLIDDERDRQDEKWGPPDRLAPNPHHSLSAAAWVEALQQER